MTLLARTWRSSLACLLLAAGASWQMPAAPAAAPACVAEPAGSIHRRAIDRAHLSAEVAQRDAQVQAALARIHAASS